LISESFWFNFKLWINSTLFRLNLSSGTIFFKTIKSYLSHLDHIFPKCFKKWRLLFHRAKNKNEKPGLMYTHFLFSKLIHLCFYQNPFGLILSCKSTALCSDWTYHQKNTSQLWMQRSLIHECMLEREDYIPSRAMPAVPLSFHRSPRVFSHSRTKKMRA